MPQASASALQLDDDGRSAPPRARRTVTITGRPDKRLAPAPPIREPGLERSVVRGPQAAPAVPSVRTPRFVEIQRRRPRARTLDRVGPRPDKVAMWAVLMALFLILVTVASSHAAG